MRAYARWQDAFDAELQARLERLLASEQPRVRMAAAIALHAGRGGELTPAEAERVAALVADAIDAAPTDATMLALAQQLCLQTRACDADAIAAWRVQAEPDNMALWLDGLEREAGDEAGDARQAPLDAIARGTRFELHETAFASALLEPITAAPFPSLDGSAARGAARVHARALGYRPTARDLAVERVVSVAAAQSLPPLQGLLRACRPDPAAAWPAACERAYRQMALSPSLLARQLALVALVKRHAEGPAGAHWRDAMRGHAWVSRLASLVPADRRFHRELWTVGEWPAMVALLRRRGLRERPPTGWLPTDPRLRALITTGREPRG